MMERDKKKHIAVGFGLGFLGGWIGFVIGAWIIPLSIFFPLVIGVAKELYDIKKTGFDWKDLLADMIGASPAIILWCLISMINDYEGIF